MSNTERAKPYFLGVVLAIIAFASCSVNSFLNPIFNIGTLLTLCSILFGLFYCLNPKASNKKFIVISYILVIANSVVSMVNYMQLEYDDMMLYQEQIDQMRAINIGNVLIVNLIPAVLMLIGTLKSRKIYGIIVMCLEVLIVTVVSMASFSATFIAGSRASLFSNIASLLIGLYTIVVWYKVSLDTFFKTKTREDMVYVDEKEIISTEMSLKKLKKQYENGDISEAEYTEKKSLIMSKMLS